MTGQPLSAQPSTEPSPPPSTDEALLTAMIASRAFDVAMAARNRHWHPAEGEEAVVVGAYSGLRPGDVAVPHFRGAFAVPLMRGTDPYVIALNVFGKADGTTAGRWRGDICVQPSRTLLGMFSGSLGTSVGYAAGAALTAALSGSGAVAVTSFGDGTANTGILFETLNLAAMLSLPVVFVCQDNQYATSLRSTYSLAGNSVASRARAFGIPAVDVDGNDVLDVRAAVDEALDRARAGAGPSLVHALTYRIGGHFMSDPEVYRSPEEVADWRAKDPIVRLADRLVADGRLRAGAIDALRAEAEQTMTDAITRAQEAAEAESVAARDEVLVGGER